MAFDADLFVEAHVEPPAFTWKARRFVGRILSADEWVRLHATNLKARADVAVVEGRMKESGDTSEVDRVVRTALHAAKTFSRDCITSWFPAPWYLRPLAAVWPGLFHPAWRAFRSMPPIAQEKAIADFSESQRRAMPESRPNGTSTTNQTPTPRSDT